MSPVELKIKLKELRKELGLTQQELADRLNISRQSVIAIESGVCKPSLPLAFDLANIFETSLEGLFGLEDFEPYKLIRGGNMPNIIPWSPLHEMREAIDRMMDENFALPAKFSTPAINVHQSDKEVVVEAHVPGYKEEDIEVEISDGLLTISGKTEVKKEEEKGKQYLHREWSAESFSRTISLPENVTEEKAEASIKDGVLTITLPKIEPEKPRVKKLKVGRK